MRHFNAQYIGFKNDVDETKPYVYADDYNTRTEAGESAKLGARRSILGIERQVTPDFNHL